MSVNQPVAAALAGAGGALAAALAMAPAPLTALDLSERLQAHLAAALADVRVGGKKLTSYGALDFAAAQPGLRAPCTAVAPVDDRPGPPLQPGIDVQVVQQVRTTVAVVLGVAAPNDAAGTRALRRPLAAVRAAVLGWAPEDPPRPPGEGRWRPLVFQRGRLLSFAEGRAWWQDEYSSDWLLSSRPRKAAPDPAPTEVCVSVNGAPPVPLREALDG